MQLKIKGNHTFLANDIIIKISASMSSWIANTDPMMPSTSGLRHPPGVRGCKIRSPADVIGFHGPGTLIQSSISETIRAWGSIRHKGSDQEKGLLVNPLYSIKAVAHYRTFGCTTDRLWLWNKNARVFFTRCFISDPQSVSRTTGRSVVCGGI